MRWLLLIFMAFVLFLVNIAVSHLIARGVKKKFSESYLLLNKAVLVGLPRDLHFGASNMNFVNTLSFIGYALEKGRGHITRKQAYKVYASLDTVTMYNPRYFDPYYVANAFLTWDVGLYEETIVLLRRGMKYINDWRIPFYIGFIYFYFLGDNLKGAEYLKIAMRYMGAEKSDLIPLLASRLYYEEGRYKLAIILLKEQLRDIKNEGMKKVVITRLKTLEIAYTISKALELFRKKFGKAPKDIKELEKAGLIPKGLKDPLGGRFYITQDGKVRSEKVLFPIKRKMIERERKR